VAAINDTVGKSGAIEISEENSKWPQNWKQALGDSSRENLAMAESPDVAQGLSREHVAPAQ
jgi:hypothetical protein